MIWPVVNRSWLIGNSRSPTLPPPARVFFPLLYIADFGRVHVDQRSAKSWTLFPDTTLGEVAEGGYLPHVDVTSLSPSIGNIDPDTGMPNLAGPFDPERSSPPGGRRPLAGLRPLARAPSPSTWHRWCPPPRCVDRRLRPDRLPTVRRSSRPRRLWWTA